MSNIRYPIFRNLLTERFTVVTLDVFKEVGNIIEEYYEENERPRSVIQTSLDSVMKLARVVLLILC